ncbi:MAG: hypothetical protein IKU12_05295 [Oscillospiraceae bacterium]|nr:hypothetical protein [Oscillospiraceae bacterium]
MDAETFACRAADYFASADEAGDFYGEGALALSVGMTLQDLRAAYDGGTDAALTAAVRHAYLRIQAQIESSRRYADRGLNARATFFLKQPRFGGYSEKGEGGEVTLKVIWGKGMDEGCAE